MNHKKTNLSLRICFSILIIFTLGCQAKPKETLIDETKKENLEEVKKQVKPKFYNLEIRNSLDKKEEIFLSNFTNEIQYIKLESNPSCLISKVDNLKIYNNYIFIQDTKKGLFKFDMEGKFIQKIGKIGAGPGEYGMVLRFTIVEKTNEIMLYAYPAGRINVYDAETGIFKRGFKPVDNNSFVEFPPGKLSFFTPSSSEVARQEVKNGIFISTLEGQIIDSIPDSRSLQTGNMSSRMINYRINGSLCYMGSFQDTLAVLSENMKKEPHVCFKLDNSIKGAEMKLERKIGEIQFPDFLSIEQILENDRYYFVEIQAGIGLYVESDIYKFLYDKTSCKLSHCSALANDVDGGMPFWPEYINNKTELINVYHPYEIIEHLQSNKDKTEKSEKFVSMANSLSENDNPVLILVKLKE